MAEQGVATPEMRAFADEQRAAVRGAERAAWGDIAATVRPKTATLHSSSACT